MALITWDTSLSVGVTEMDQEHQKLIAMINELHEAMSDRRAAEVLEGIIDGLIAYTKTHFANEEEFFDKFCYPHKASHKAEHRAFVEKISQVKVDYKAGKLMLSMEIMNYLKEWLFNHISGTDQKYTAFFHEHGVA